MRRTSRLVTILITGFTLALSGLVASPIASAVENYTVRISATFAFGSPLLSNAQKSAIKEVVTTTGTDATFIVTGVAGKLPGVSGIQVQLLAKKRAKAVESYLVKLGVNQASVTTEVKITRLGMVPKTKLVGRYAAQVLTTASATSTTNAPAAPTAALVCATGGTCVVGDRGPGGGIVYYVSLGNFTSTGSTCDTTCKYLEVAPATWQSAGLSFASDAKYAWSDNTTATTVQDKNTVSTEGNSPLSSYEKLNWKIGQGFNNTKIMKVTGATSDAQTAVLAYAGGSTAGQWFIPSMNELNELCKYARGQTTGDLRVTCDTTGTLKTGTTDDLGGFFGFNYWASSEYSALSTWDQDFRDGGQGNYHKYVILHVRPVRAF